MMGTVASVVSAGVGLYGAVSGGGDGGGGGGLSLDEARARARQEFQSKYNAWEKYWNERIPRMTDSQKEIFAQTKKLMGKYRPLFAAHFKEQDREKVYRNFIEDLDSLTDTRFKNLRTQINRLSKGEKDAIFRGRVNEAEQEINRASAETIDMLLRQNRRNINRGGLTGFNPEREDEMIAGTMQRARDEARAKARSQVENTLMGLLQRDIGMTAQELGAYQQLIPSYKNLAEEERKRLMQALQAEFGFDYLPIQQKEAMMALIDKLKAERYADRPDQGDIMRSWLTGSQGQTGPSTAQTIQDIGGLIGGKDGKSGLLEDLYALWNKFTTTPSLPTDPGGQVGPW